MQLSSPSFASGMVALAPPAHRTTRWDPNPARGVHLLLASSSRQPAFQIGLLLAAKGRMSAARRAGPLERLLWGLRQRVHEIQKVDDSALK